MIADPISDRRDRLHDALTRHITGLKRRALDQWAVDDVRVLFNPDDGWLCINAPGGPDVEALNLSAGVKLAGNGLLRAEAVLSSEETDFDMPVSRLWMRFCAARSGAALAGEEAPLPDIAQLCTEAGWPFTSRAEGRVAVPLESGDVPATAIVACDATRTIRVAVDILECEVLDNVSRRAIGLLLERLCDCVRLVRTAVVNKEEAVTVRLEVALDAWATATELAYAFGALSVACRWGGREFEALQDAGIAKEFLAGTKTGRNTSKKNEQSADKAGKEES
jgi:hypothetical protein